MNVVCTCFLSQCWGLESQLVVTSPCSCYAVAAPECVSCTECPALVPTGEPTHGLPVWCVAGWVLRATYACCCGTKIISNNGLGDVLVVQDQNQHRVQPTVNWAKLPFTGIFTATPRMPLSFSWRWNFLRIVEFQWFFTALSVLPGSSFAICAQWFPCRLCASNSTFSSTLVHGSLRISGFKWLCHLSRHCLPLRPGMVSAMRDHPRGPYLRT